jgi:hypothetical protein
MQLQFAMSIYKYIRKRARLRYFCLISYRSYVIEMTA